MTHISQPIDEAISATQDDTLEINLHGYVYVISFITVPLGGTLGLEGSADYGAHWSAIDWLDLADPANPASVASVSSDGVYAIYSVFRQIRIVTSVGGTVAGRIVGTAFHPQVTDTGSSPVSLGSLLGTVIEPKTEEMSISPLKPIFEYTFHTIVDPKVFTIYTAAAGTATVDTTNAAMVLTQPLSFQLTKVFAKQALKCVNRIGVVRFTAKVVNSGNGFNNMGFGLLDTIDRTLPNDWIGFYHRLGNWAIHADHLAGDPYIFQDDWLQQPSFTLTTNEWYHFEIRIFGNRYAGISFHIYDPTPKKWVEVYYVDKMNPSDGYGNSEQDHYRLGAFLAGRNGQTPEIQIHNMFMGIRDGPELVDYPNITDSTTSPTLPDPTQQRIAVQYYITDELGGAYNNTLGARLVSISGIMIAPGNVNGILKLYYKSDLNSIYYTGTELYSNSLIYKVTSFSPPPLVVADLGTLVKSFPVVSNKPFRFEVNFDLFPRYLSVIANDNLLFWMDATSPVTVELHCEWKEKI